MLLSLIAVIDEEQGIGKDNALLCHLPADLAHFKQLTLGKPIIMGRKTFESIGRPLPGRLNIVLSGKPDFKPDGVTVVDSLDKALSSLTHFAEVMVIGGATLYEQAIELADRLYLTQIHYRFEADTFFPTWQNADFFQQSYTFYPHDEKNQYDHSYIVLERLKADPKQS